MSLRTISVSCLSIKPRIDVSEDYLHARTPFLVEALSLFSYRREVRVDRLKRIVKIQTVKFWIFDRVREIPFENVDYIDTGFDSMGTEWGVMGKTDQVERYRVSLALKEPKEGVPLFSFIGEGSVETGWAGVLLGGDGVFDLAGDQDQTFRNSLGLLKHFLGVPIGKPAPQVIDSEGFKYRCAVCGRSSAPNRDTCLYCGERIEKYR